MTDEEQNDGEAVLIKRLEEACAHHHNRARLGLMTDSTHRYVVSVLQSIMKRHAIYAELKEREQKGE